MAKSARILARGPWRQDQVSVRWRSEQFEPDPDTNAAADSKIKELAERGSPTYDGQAARLCEFVASDEGLLLDLQPMRWSLRLVDQFASSALSILCVTRDADGRWLAGKRAAWVATWAGRWTLGAGGAVEVDEHPFAALERELSEEWSVSPQRLSGEVVLELPNGLVMFVGVAWLGKGAQVKREAEHDEHAWWPAEIEKWPAHAEAPLVELARLVGQQ